MTPRTPILALVALLVPGCAWITKDELAGREDRDQDGHVAAQFGGDDCDDGDADVHPDAVERCDGLDEDCDGSIDDVDAEGGSAWYTDADGDGAGDPDAPLYACTQPEDSAEDATDCDDGDPEIHPGVAEVCDGVDQDCDGEIDDSALDVTTWYADRDEDGYGDDDDTTAACQAPSGAVDVGGDCDDGDADIHPGATEVCSEEDHNCDGVPGQEDRDEDGVEGCAGDCDDADAGVYPDAPETCDGIDDDCDGLVDDDDPGLLTSDLTRYYPDADGDLYGDSSSAGEQACVAPTGTVTDHADCDDGDADINPDAYEVCSTTADDDCDGDTSDCALTLDDELLVFSGADSAEEAGAALSASIDIDGDGLDDLVVSSPGRYAQKGAVYVVTGATSADTDLGAATTWKGNDSADRAGSALAAADLDRDGYGDVVVGAPGAGQVYLLTDPRAGGGLSGAGTVISGDSDGSFGATLALGDLDGDGQPDVAVGMPDADTTGALGVTVTGVGGVEVYFGAFTGDLSDSDASVTNADETDGHLGRAIAAVDADGDGQDELVVSGLDTDLLSADVPRISLMDVTSGGEVDAGSALRTYSGGSGRASGDALCAGGDVDGDGTEDLLVGDPAAAQAFLLLGPLGSAPTSLSSADAVLSGETGFGGALLLLSDVDGDGADEVVVGASNGASLWMGGASFTGAHSATGADLSLDGDRSGDEAGAALSAGDVDGDGSPDLVVGAPGAVSGTGEAIIVLGAPF